MKVGSAATGSVGPSLLRGPCTARQSSPCKQKLLCSDTSRACNCKWESWAAREAATVSSDVHAAHLRLHSTNCSPSQLSTSHHLIPPVFCSSMAPPQINAMMPALAKQQHSAHSRPWHQSPLPAGLPVSLPTAAAPSRRAAMPRPWPMQLSSSTGPMVGQGELHGQPQLPRTGSGVWVQPTVSGSSCYTSWRGRRRGRHTSRRESGGACAQSM